MLLKVALCLGVLLLVDAASVENPLRLKIFHNDFFDRQLELDEELADDVNVKGSAVVLKSNLPVSVQNQLATALTTIYQTTSDKLQRAQHFQTSLARVYSVYWSVVINFDVITFYSQYYILLQIDGDRVLGFGLS